MQEHDAKLQQVADFFDREVTTFLASRVFLEHGSRLAEIAMLKPGERVLDIGTGAGAVLFPAAEAVGDRGLVVGIDLAEAMATATRAEALRKGVVNVELHQMNAEQLTFPDGSFDAVVSGFVFQFIPDLARTLAEVRRVLSPGGRVAVSVWGPMNELTRRTRDLRNEYPDPVPVPSSQTFASPEALGQPFEKAGFRILQATAESRTYSFANEDDYWGQRLTQHNDNLPVDLMARYKEQVFEVLRATRSPDGQLQETRTAIYVVATPGTE